MHYLTFFSTSFADSQLFHPIILISMPLNLTTLLTAAWLFLLSSTVPCAVGISIKTREVFFVMDYARRHKSKNLKVPKNIKTIYLPPYSLEFNPIERLCLYIKQNVLRNKVYNAVALLESALANLLPFFPTL
ncbi:hypothetical protein GO684_00315 [Wolbachia endosymbiont of Litomosoides brasiliensis]|nr:hypothetical protein [Wolbachia endosymbiont of Litomosoides brasiliensis]